MTLKETLDKLTQIIRLVQYANDSLAEASSEQITQQLHDFLILVGQALVERDEANEALRIISTRLWMSHVKGHLDCPACSSLIPIEFFVGSKGVAGAPVAAHSKDELMQKLEFPPITMQELSSNPIPDYMPEQI